MKTHNQIISLTKWPIVRTPCALFMSILLLNLAHHAYALPGDLDFSFDRDGVIDTGIDPVGFSTFVSAVKIQADRKIVVGGAASRTDGGSGNFHHFFLARFTAMGSLDTTFGSGGRVITEFTSQFGAGGGFADLAMHTDGKFVAVGFTDQRILGGIVVFTRFALARYNSNGSLDTTFGSGGKVTIAFADGRNEPEAVAIQSDGRIIVAGSVTGNFAIARFNVNGSVDMSFGLNGLVTIPSFGPAHDVAIQGDGRILVASSSGDFAVLRFNANGTPDSTFDGDGRATTSFSSPSGAMAVAVQTDGKIVAVGVADGLFKMVRYQSNGSLDTAFGSSGRVESSRRFASAVTVHPDGKILTLSGDGAGAKLTRFNPTGFRDATFGVNGDVNTGVAGVSPRALAIQKNDGRVTVCGDRVERYHACACADQNVTILGTEGPDIITGTKVKDVIFGLGGDDVIRGGAGNDIICGGNGNDSLFGEDGGDTLLGDAGIDSLNGGGGSDTGIDGNGTTFTSCETIFGAFGGISGAWESVEQKCHSTGKAQILACTLAGTIAVFNPRTDSTVLPATAAFYLSSDAVWDEGDLFLEYADIPVLEGEESKDVKLHVNLPEGHNASGQFVIAVLDAFDVVPEVNEENNIVASPPIP